MELSVYVAVYMFGCLCSCIITQDIIAKFNIIKVSPFRLCVGSVGVYILASGVFLYVW